MPVTIDTNRMFTLITSDIVTVGTEIVIGTVDATRPHCFAGVQLFDNAGGTVVATPSAGTVVITVQTVNTAPIFEAVPANTIDVTDQKTVSWAANTVKVKAVPDSIADATHYRLLVTCNNT